MVIRQRISTQDELVRNNSAKMTCDSAKMKTEAAPEIKRKEKRKTFLDKTREKFEKWGKSIKKENIVASQNKEFQYKGIVVDEKSFTDIQCFSGKM